MTTLLHKDYLVHLIPHLSRSRIMVMYCCIKCMLSTGANLVDRCLSNELAAGNVIKRLLKN